MIPAEDEGSEPSRGGQEVKCCCIQSQGNVGALLINEQVGLSESGNVEQGASNRCPDNRYFSRQRTQTGTSETLQRQISHTLHF